MYETKSSVNGNEQNKVTEDDQVLIESTISFGAGLQAVKLYYAEGFQDFYSLNHVGQWYQW